MGSRFKINTNNLAYIAGFLDGDGSLMLQIKKRSDTKKGVRFMATICLYQDTRHEKPLLWMRKVFGVGYISRRNDGMSELRINGFKTIKEILLLLQPFIKFKSKQTKALIEACEILSSVNINNLSKQQIRRIVDLVLIIKKENYASRSTLNKKDLYRILGLTP
ncbi:MAG: LAGLIDADG family homing endonuclease [Candidatus Pacebacteria bacterium]|nr:LAGLIDADG family homing endonuclease [Candidatus Paceibacterota bacterium]